MVFADVGDGIYKVFYLLHIVAVIVGLGSVVLNGVYAAQAKARTGVGAVAIVEATEFVTWKISQWFIYSIPIWGFALLGLSDGVWEFSELWVWLSLVLYVVAVGISHAVMKPAVESYRAALAGGGSGGASTANRPDLAALDKRLAAGGGALNVLLLVILILMIWKPGN